MHLLSKSTFWKHVIETNRILYFGTSVISLKYFIFSNNFSSELALCFTWGLQNGWASGWMSDWLTEKRKLSHGSEGAIWVLKVHFIFLRLPWEAYQIANGWNLFLRVSRFTVYGFKAREILLKSICRNFIVISNICLVKDRAGGGWSSWVIVALKNWATATRISLSQKKIP